MSTTSKAKSDRQSTRRQGGRYETYDRCTHCNRIITDATGWWHIEDGDPMTAAILAAGKKPSGMICGKCQDKYRAATSTLR